MYDIVVIGENNLNWSTVKTRFPLAKRAASLEDAKKKAFTKMFWIVWDDVVVDPNFSFEYEVTEWDQQYIHIFKNGSYYDGICLVPKSKTFFKKEVDYRFFVEKKEIDVIASNPRPYDVVFISYNEPNADENYKKLLTRCPKAKRIHGVKGIHQAHIQAAEICETDMFWVVDADAVLLEDFEFDYQVAKWDKECVHVWRSRNPINDLEYGYGGVKLLPRNLVLSMDTTTSDMTTSLSPKFKAIEKVSNLSEFNTDPYSAWRSAFRECAKLASRTISRQIDSETEERLNIWCTVGKDKKFGTYAIAGANAGKQFAEENPNQLHLINNFDWLYEQFSKCSV